MGVNTDATICFGISYEEGHQFPWHEGIFAGEINDWWCAQHGKSFDKYEDKKKWLEKNPLPVEVVYHCTGDDPMFILAIPGTERTAWRGDPVELKFSELQAAVTDEKFVAFNTFINNYNLGNGTMPTWWLASYWG